jgi:hypothetical protein
MVHHGTRLEEANVWVGRIALLGIERDALEILAEGEAVDVVS